MIAECFYLHIIVKILYQLTAEYDAVSQYCIPYSTVFLTVSLYQCIVCYVQSILEVSCHNRV